MLNASLDTTCEGPNEIDAYTLLIPSYADKYTFETWGHESFATPIGETGTVFYEQLQMFLEESAPAAAESLTAMLLASVISLTAILV